jgi:hypothetical protein
MEKPLRQDVVDARKPISAQGFGDPAETTELLTGTPKPEGMLEAEQLFDAWYEVEDAKPKSPEEALRFQFETTILYVEAGFIGPDYLDEVANDWLAQDSDAAIENGFFELAAEIDAKIDELNLLRQRR